MTYNHQRPAAHSKSGVPPGSSARVGIIAWAFYDWANSAFPTVVLTFVFASYFTRHVAPNEALGSALWGNTVAAAEISVAVVGPMLGAIADQTGRNKLWIAAFTLLCAASAGLLWFVNPSPQSVWLALVLVGIGVFASDCALIFYNAMLPRLAVPEEVGRWSGWSWGMGYAGGLLCLVISLFVFVEPVHPWIELDQESAEHIRATFVFVSGWYLLFSLPLFFLTPGAHSEEKTISQALRAGLAQLRDTFRKIRRYMSILRFLIARMFYIDGVGTLFVFGGVYAAGTFAMGERQILLFGIAINAAAGVGAALFGWIDDWIGARRTILVALLGLILPGSAILLVQSPTLFWLFALLLGVFVGPVQAASRSYLSRIAPPELQNELFGFYALSGKATAFLGPLLVGWLTYGSGSQRFGMSVIVLFLLIGFILMLRVTEQTTEKARSNEADSAEN
ncbi:MAG TPA: MFS transporter [Candidatus Binatia bacterium]